MEPDSQHSPVAPVAPVGKPADRASRSRHAPPRIVFSALVFYGLLLAVALLWSWLSGDSLLYANAEAAAAGVDWARDIAAGAATAAIAIVLSQQLTLRTAWGIRMARIMAALLGRLDWPRCLLLAALSGIAEEAFFRGALQPRIGLVGASLLFGLAHFAPRRELVPWTVLSLVAGFALGGLFAATGNLVAPVIAHAGINAVNLRFVSARYASA